MTGPGDAQVPGVDEQVAGARSPAQHGCPALEVAVDGDGDDQLVARAEVAADDARTRLAAGLAQAPGQALDPGEGRRARQDE